MLEARDIAGHARVSYQSIDRQTKDVIPNDLSATLASHRASNRASVIRFVAYNVNPESVHINHSITSRSESIPIRRPSRIEPTNHDSTHGSPEASVPERMEAPVHIIHHGSKVRGLKKVPRERNNLKNKGVLEYQGRAFRPLKAASDGQSPPWLPMGDMVQFEGVDRLSAEIKAFASFLTPTAPEQTAREALTAEVQSFVKEAMPECGLELFGSQKNSLAFPTSDIDFRLCHPDLEAGGDQRGPSLTRRQNLKIMLKRLHSLQMHFSKHPSYWRCILRIGRYPLLSISHRQSGLEIQIVSCNDTVASREYMKNYLAEYPSLRPTFMVLKSLLQVRGMTDVFRGGLGSYTIFMMIVASLKLNDSTDPADLGRQLLSFLWFYSKLDTYKHGVSVEPPALFKKRSASEKLTKEKLEAAQQDAVLLGQSDISVIHQTQPYLLCLQDPADASNDLGRKAYAIKHIKQTIKFVYEQLLSMLSDKNTASMLAPLLGNSYEQFAKQRTMLSSFGANRSVTVHNG